MDRYLDFDLRIERQGDGFRASVVQSPAGQGSAAFRLPFSALELENLILRIGQGRPGVRGIGSREAQSVQAFGRRLFDAVFDGELNVLLRSSMVAAEGQGAGLRIRLLLSQAPELSDLPWEFLYSSSLNRYFGLSRETPVVRYLDLPGAARPLAAEPPLRILVMVANPASAAYPPLDVDAEWRGLQGALAGLAAAGKVVLERLPRATLSELQHRLRRSPCHVFHFIGHGAYDEASQDGMLLLEDEAGQPRLVSGTDLGTLLHDHRALRLAVLNACEGARTGPGDPFSGTAHSLLQQGLPAVVGMQFAISDRAAITFAREFYLALADGYAVDASLAEARKAIFSEGNAVEWGTPVLYLRSPDGRVFDWQPATQAGERAGPADSGAVAVPAVAADLRPAAAPPEAAPARPAADLAAAGGAHGRPPSPPQPPTEPAVPAGQGVHTVHTVHTGPAAHEPPQAAAPAMAHGTVAMPPPSVPPLQPQPQPQSQPQPQPQPQPPSGRPIADRPSPGPEPAPAPPPAGESHRGHWLALGGLGGVVLAVLLAVMLDGGSRDEPAAAGPAAQASAAPPFAVADGAVPPSAPAAISTAAPTSAPAAAPTAAPAPALPAPKLVGKTPEVTERRSLSGTGAPAEPTDASGPDPWVLYRQAQAGDVAARRRLQAQAEAGRAQSQFVLGQLLYQPASASGLAADPAAAVAWWERASAQAFGLASLALGNVYDRGRDSIGADPARALQYYERAVAQGQVGAQPLTALAAALLRAGLADQCPRILELLERAAADASQGQQARQILASSAALKRLCGRELLRR